MEDKKDLIAPLLQKARDYGDTSLQLLKLQAVDKTAGLLSGLLSRALALAAFMLALLLLSTGLAFWLGSLLGNTYLGFLCVGGFYFLLFLVQFFLIHKLVKRKTCDSIITEMLN